MSRILFAMERAMQTITQTTTGRKVEIRILTREILVVATFTYGKAWKAYIGIVPGRDHDEEWEQVLQTGDTLDEVYARPMFPNFAKFEYDR
jgi:hypothetical protein